LRIKNSAKQYPRGSLHKKDYATEQPTCSVLRTEKSTVSTTHLTCQEVSGQHKGLLKDTKNHSSVYHGPSLNTLHTDCTKGWPKGLLKDTKNHSSVYHGPSLNTLHTDCTKGWPKGLLKDTKNHSSVYLGPSPIHCIRIVAT
jgi:hypothetical protein